MYHYCGFFELCISRVIFFLLLFFQKVKHLFTVLYFTIQVFFKVRLGLTMKLRFIKYHCGYILHQIMYVDLSHKQYNLGPDHVQVNCSWKWIEDWKWSVGGKTVGRTSPNFILQFTFSCNSLVHDPIPYAAHSLRALLHKNYNCFTLNF